MPSDFWTETRIADLRHLYCTEGMTCQAIAERFGCTKNVIIGKALRMGLQRDPEAPLSPAQRGLQKALEARHEREAARRRLSFQYPKAGGCHWPVGHPNEPEFHFCGDRIAFDGSPYCAPHRARAYRKSLADDF